MSCCHGIGLGHSRQLVRLDHGCAELRVHHRPRRQKLGEDEQRLYEIALYMEPEDGCISVLDINDVSTVAFTAEGVENLKELLHLKPSPGQLCRRADTVVLGGWLR
jgi:hypothetical protein